MKKYGVDEVEKPGEKQAGTSTERRCPLCGQILEQHGQVYLCPEHGSKPFEHE